MPSLPSNNKRKEWQMTEKQPVAVVSRAVYDFVERIREEQPEQMSSISGMVKLAKGDKEKEAARWIKLNPIAYGVGYWNGFLPDDQPTEKSEPEEIVDDIIENSKKVQEHAENIKEQLEEQPARKRKRIPPTEADNE